LVAIADKLGSGGQGRILGVVHIDAQLAAQTLRMRA
jgi:hypothetical protein